jgi:hypothetical protein
MKATMSASFVRIGREPLVWVPLWRSAFCADSRLHLPVISKHDIDRLRARAAHYRREAARANTRSRLIYCRALANHLDREALELERVIKSNSPGDLVSVG